MWCQVLSQRHFPKGDLQSDNFPSENFPKVRLGPLSQAPQAAIGGRALRLGRARGPSSAAKTGWGTSAWEISHLGSCQLGKYPWEVTAYEKFVGKLPNVFPCLSLSVLVYSRLSLSILVYLCLSVPILVYTFIFLSILSLSILFYSFLSLYIELYGYFADLTSAVGTAN